LASPAANVTVPLSGPLSIKTARLALLPERISEPPALIDPALVKVPETVAVPASLSVAPLAIVLAPLRTH
jgi:hypothetical protein